MIGKKSTQASSSKERIAEHLRAADQFVKEGRYDDALQQIEQALRLEPRNLYARSFLERVRSLAERAQKDPRQRLAAAAQEEAKLRQIGLLLKAAEQLVQAKKYTLAQQQVQKVYEIDPHNYYAQSFADRIQNLMREEKKTAPVTEERQPATPLAQQPEPAAQESAAGDRASLAMYRELLKEMWFDGKITSEEAKELKKIRQIFKISQKEHEDLEKQVHVDAYVEALRIAWTDGTVSENGSEVLRMMREKYNISMEEHVSAEAKILWAKAAPPGKAAILLVDDDKAFLLSLAATLRSYGYDVTTTESVEEALASLEQKVPSLILADLLFPEGQLNGIDFYQRVRDNPKLKDLPFLLISGVSDEFVIRAGVRMGVDSFIQKPFDLELLLATIDGKLKA
ncbi:MAG: response regulator [Ignavibacteria bacterium]|nr:response regulator [Ignavibacteria bacterium]